MIGVNGRDWRTLGEPIHINRKTVEAVYMGGRKVYPEGDSYSATFVIAPSYTIYGDFKIMILGGTVRGVVSCEDVSYPFVINEPGKLISLPYINYKQYTVTIEFINAKVAEFWIPDDVLCALPGSHFPKMTALSLGDDIGDWRNGMTNAFWQAKSLESLPSGFFDYAVDEVACIECFWKCSSLKTVPADLFQKNKNLQNFQSCFAESGLTEIPAKFFSGNPKAKNFDYCFEYCPLTTIPGDIFENCVNAVHFNYCFFKCNDLLEVPAGLFRGCVKGRDFHCTFQSCKALTTIHENVFPDGARLFEHCFANCENLTTIPAGLFPPGTQNVSRCFESCYGLTEVSPAVFQNVSRTLPVNFVGCFSGCQNLRVIPPLWEMFPNARGDLCFSGCHNAANWEDVPNPWR